MIKLRPYQQVAEDKIREFLTSPDTLGSYGVVVSPVASGKSILIASAARFTNAGVLVLQPSVELLKQNYAKYTSYGLEATIYSASAGEKQLSKVTFATLGSIKTLAKDIKRLGIKTIVVDECDKQFPPDKWTRKDGKSKLAKSMFTKLLYELEPERIIGFTATPFITKAVGRNGTMMIELLTDVKPRIYDTIIHVEQIKTMTTQRYWADLNYRSANFDEGMLQYNSNGTEFTEESIKEANKKLNVNNNIYLDVMDLVKNPDNQILLFAESVTTANKFAEVLPFAEVVTGETPKKVRATRIADFQSGKVRVLVNVGCLTTGFDAPTITHVILGRPTGSFSLFYQMCGRAVRLHPRELSAHIWDYCGNVKRFGTIESLNIFNHPEIGYVATINGKLLTGVRVGSRITIDKFLERKKTPQFVTITRFPFGKAHKGKFINQIPLNYLNWALENCDALKGYSNVVEEIKRFIDFSTIKR